MSDGSAPLDNHRHELFSQGVASGKCQKQAYLDAGYKATDAAEQNACRLIRTDKVAARVAFLRAQAGEKAGLDRQAVITRYLDLCDGSAGEGKWETAGNLLQRAADYAGIDPKVVHPDPSAVQPGGMIQQNIYGSLPERVEAVRAPLKLIEGSKTG